jgi:hypothetical protein
VLCIRMWYSEGPSAYTILRPRWWQVHCAGVSNKEDGGRGKTEGGRVLYRDDLTESFMVD